MAGGVQPREGRHGDRHRLRLPVDHPATFTEERRQRQGRQGDKDRPVPHAPPGYRLLFANKPFAFTPPPSDGQANHLERAALPGPAELVYNSDGRLGSILVVVGERETVCTEEQQTAVLSHPLPAAGLSPPRLAVPTRVRTVVTPWGAVTAGIRPRRRCTGR
ncbi:hypothetical protein ACFYY3_06655 [Streptomyces sp. NPDC001812]|uniref:hypothetical protein n=1 Tax=Streptomyces sp. NPDC001812 TaxID=3364611 RepID=UPI0036AAC206